MLGFKPVVAFWVKPCGVDTEYGLGHLGFRLTSIALTSGLWLGLVAGHLVGVLVPFC